MELSSDQSTCLNAIMEWYKHTTDQLLTMGGYAGTGKTTLVSVFRSKLSERTRIAFAAYTGKAASVLRAKLIKANCLMVDSDYCGTIHSLIYKPVIDPETGEIIDWELQPGLDYDLIVIDESSMVSKNILDDLASYGIPILAIGDHGQLPPIEGSFNLMENPILRLEKIHRQSENNPIIKLSILAREEGFIPYQIYADGIAKVDRKHKIISQFVSSSGDFMDTAILCGFNHTRVKINNQVRSFFKYSGPYPQEKERVICLRNNKEAKDCPVYNGIQGTVVSCDVKTDHLKMEIKLDGEPLTYKGYVTKLAFGEKKPDLGRKPLIIKKKNKETGRTERKEVYPDVFDFGYALTVHKSQGSEWKRVMVIEEPCPYWDGNNWNRWLYTAVTRASEQLVIVR